MKLEPLSTLPLLDPAAIFAEFYVMLERVLTVLVLPHFKAFLYPPCVNYSLT